MEANEYNILENYVEFVQHNLFSVLHAIIIMSYEGSKYLSLNIEIFCFASNLRV